MTLDEITALDEQYYLNVFGKRQPVCFERGNGIHLYDTEGKEYTDFFAGIAVCALGYSHPAVVRAIQQQAEKLIHCSNLYYIEAQARLAELLCTHSCADKIFLCNSGAEANEGALKLARAYFKKKGQPEKANFVCLTHSFHGRTITTATATGQVKYNKLYEPLTPGFVHVPLNDWDALEQAVDGRTCGILLEPVQGESGVYPLDTEYVRRIRKLCEERDILLLFDEVQTGLGRTGYLFGYERYGVEPDIFTLAKALGGGVPIGCVCARENVAGGFAPGDHGSTFGGNPLACAAALAAVTVILEEKLPEHAGQMGGYLKQRLEELRQDCAAHSDSFGTIKEIRCVGLMAAVEWDQPVAASLRSELFRMGWLVGSVGTNILRILPPLIIQREDVDGFVAALRKIVLPEGEES